MMAVPLVGRDREIAMLRGWLDEALSGHGRVALVGGEAGIGKTALASWLASEARNGGARVLIGRSTEAEGAPPNWPWLQVLDVLEARGLLDAPAGSDPDSEQFIRRNMARQAVLEQRGVVVIEDAHRADRASLRLLTHVAERVADAAVLLVVTFRSEPSDHAEGFRETLHELGRTRGVARVDLGGVDRAAVAQLLPEGTTLAVADGVAAASNGNPLLVRELAHHLTRGGDLATVPRSIRDGVAVRMSHLSQECADTIRFAAVAGREFDAGLIATVTGRAALIVLAALDHAIAAGMIEPGGTPGSFRFVHALTRDAVLATIGVGELAARHRDLALALVLYDGERADPSELARLWDAASPLGDHAVAAAACGGAAAAAEARLAWDHAARWYQRAVVLSGDALSVDDAYTWSIGTARALAHVGELSEASEWCMRASNAARNACWTDRQAEALLVIEGRGIHSPEFEQLALTALRDLPSDAHRLRASLHAQLTNAAFYHNQATMEGHCVASEREAELADDPVAEIAALRARNMLSYGPEHAELRLALAERLGRAATSARRPSVALWEPLWRIDALVELGRLPEAVAALPELRRAAGAAGSPTARWHEARVEGALAQAEGRFQDACAHAAEARDLFARHEHPFGAHAMWIGFRVGLESHFGITADLIDAHASLDRRQMPPFLGDLPLLGVAITAVAAGDLDRARYEYRQLRHMPSWKPPPALWLQHHAVRVQLAVALDEHADLEALHEALLPYRRFHVGSGGGIVTYHGPVELWLGVAAAHLQRFDAATNHLTEAARLAHAIGARGFAIEADVELAEALLRHQKPDEQTRALRLLEHSRASAERLGMAPFLSRIDLLLADGVPTAHGPLTVREFEVAGLVAAGCTNRRIASQLYISERTAQNHVQHILTKLGLDNRTQIATWHQARADAVRR